MTPGFTAHMSSHGRKQKRTLNISVSPWEISDTYSELQMSVILMNNPKIWSLGIRFIRITLKSQHSLAWIVLQNREEIDVLLPKQGQTWAILAMWIWNWLMPLLVLVMPYWCAYHCSMYYQLSNLFVSAQVNKLQHAVPVQQRYKTTAGLEKYHSPLNGHHYKDFQAWDWQDGEAQYPSPSQFSKKYSERPQCCYSQRIGPPISWGRNAR